MRSPKLHLLLTFGVLAAGCTKAEFSAVGDSAVAPDDAGDVAAAGDTSDAGSPGDPRPEASPICPAPDASGCGTAALSPCDPVCQTGDCDWCTQKCAYAYATDNSGPVPVCASAGDQPLYSTCTQSFPGSPQQSDECAAGGICLPAFLGDTQGICFSLCRSRIDCLGGTDCGPRPLSPAGGAVSVCDPPYDRCGVDGNCCDPLAATGCDANRYCFLVSPDPSGDSRTVCEYTYGNGRSGFACVSARDCWPGYACVTGACLEVCDSAHLCPDGGCVLLGAEYGYCP